MQEGSNMSTTSNVNVKIAAGVRASAAQFPERMGPDDQLMAALEMTPAKEYELDIDADGRLVIDKDEHPDLYDWAANG
jgi:hypothetical protein